MVWTQSIKLYGSDVFKISRKQFSLDKAAIKSQGIVVGGVEIFTVSKKWMIKCPVKDTLNAVPSSDEVGLSKSKGSDEYAVQHCTSKPAQPCLIVRSDGPLAYIFLYEFFTNQKFKTLIFERLMLPKSGGSAVRALFESPCSPRPFLDYYGSPIILSVATERIQLEQMMWWLSTLGGAYSALGDISSHFAKEACRITLKQWKVAKRVGDPVLLSRCRIYAAMGLIQEGYLKHAKKILKTEFSYVKDSNDPDGKRLARMCKGVWARLQDRWHRNKPDSRGDRVLFQRRDLS